MGQCRAQHAKGCRICARRLPRMCARAQGEGRPSTTTTAELTQAQTSGGIAVVAQCGNTPHGAQATYTAATVTAPWNSCRHHGNEWRCRRVLNHPSSAAPIAAAPLATRARPIVWRASRGVTRWRERGLATSFLSDAICGLAPSRARVQCYRRFIPRGTTDLLVVPGDPPQTTSTVKEKCAARSGGNSRMVVSVSSPNHPSPPAATIAAACSARAFVLRVGRIEPTQHKRGPFVAVAQPMQRASQGPFAGCPPLLGEFGAQEGRGPVRGRMPLRLGIPLLQQLRPFLGRHDLPLKRPSMEYSRCTAPPVVGR
jgi:hypothetical protein